MGPRQGESCDIDVQAIVPAAPWCYGFHVRTNPEHCAGFGYDEAHANIVGIVLRPDEACLQEWVDTVITSLEENFPMNGGWSPARSLQVNWRNGNGTMWHRAEVPDQVFDLNIDMAKQRAHVQSNRVGRFAPDRLFREVVPAICSRSRQRLMRDWCDDHWKFMTLCWERCSLEFRPRHGETRANAVCREMFIAFIHQENQEHVDALAGADEWWNTYQSLLKPASSEPDFLAAPWILRSL